MASQFWEQTMYKRRSANLFFMEVSKTSKNLALVSMIWKILDTEAPAKQARIFGWEETNLSNI